MSILNSNRNTKVKMSINNKQNASLFDEVEEHEEDAENIMPTLNKTVIVQKSKKLSSNHAQS